MKNQTLKCCICEKLNPLVTQTHQDGIRKALAEVEKQIRVHNHLAEQWTGISFTDPTIKETTNPHTERAVELSDLKTTLQAKLK